MQIEKSSKHNVSYLEKFIWCQFQLYREKKVCILWLPSGLINPWMFNKVAYKKEMNLTTIVYTK